MVSNGGFGIWIGMYILKCLGFVNYLSAQYVAIILKLNEWDFSESSIMAGNWYNWGSKGYIPMSEYEHAYAK